MDWPREEIVRRAFRLLYYWKVDDSAQVCFLVSGVALREKLQV